MSNLHIKWSTVVIFILAAFAYGMIGNISSYLGYIIMSSLVFQGVITIIDFIFGFPMSIGRSQVYEDKPENEASRRILLLLAFGFIIFGCWAIFVKGV